MIEDQPRNMPRSVLAVAAGMGFTIITHLGTDMVMHILGILPKQGEPFTDNIAALALGYRLVWALAGSVLTAKLAPYRPMAHTMVGAGIGMLLGTAGAIATWNKVTEFGPHWYPIALILTAPPIAWLGAKIADPQA